LLQGAGDALARSTVLAARAEMAQGSERARLLYEAALAAQQAGDEARAARLARASVATEASQDALLCSPASCATRASWRRPPPR
jgi:hypothetical protein